MNLAPIPPKDGCEISDLLITKNVSDTIRLKEVLHATDGCCEAAEGSQQAQYYQYARRRFGENIIPTT